MLATEIAVGDEFRTDNGAVVYTVEKVRREGPDIVAWVRYTDGGDSIRVWPVGSTPGLVRPATVRLP